MEATRNKPRCKDDCMDHIFQIKNNNGNTKLDTQIRFCPKFRRDPHPPQKTIPEYNLDNKYFTKAFVIGTDKKTLSSNTQHEQVNFQTMIKDACEKNNQVIFPRPNQKNSFCSVCKEHYKNYYQHINTQSHRIKIDAAIYNNQIEKMCKCYKSKWDGAHEKADNILAEFVRQSQMYQNGITKDENNEQDDEEEEDENQISEEQRESEPQQIENQGQNEQANQEQISQNQEEQMQVQQKIVEPMKKKESRKSSKQQEMVAQCPSPKQKKQKDIISQSFFENRSSSVLFLKKNKNGNYEVVKDIKKHLFEQKISKANHLTNMTKQHKDNALSQYQKQKRNKQQRRKYKQSGRTKDVNRIKIPPPQKCLSSEYNGSSSYHQNDKYNICQKLKKQITKDRIKTRNQCKQTNYENIQIPLKNKHDKKQKNKDSKEEIPKQKPKPQTPQTVNKQQQVPPPNTQTERPPYPYNMGQNPNNFTNPERNSQFNHSRGMSSQMMTTSQMVNPKQQMNAMNPQGYPIYMPPHMSQMQANQMGQHNQQLPKNAKNSTPNRMGGGYMPPPPSFMMNHPQYYNNNMMGYGMSMRNESMSGNDKSKERPAGYPMYYPPSNWNHMMMNPHPMMRQPEGGSSEQSGNNVRPSPSYQMMPPSLSNPENKSAGQNLGSNVHSGMGMYMPPYSMDPRYPPYMGYPYPGKKNEEAPRDSR